MKEQYEQNVRNISENIYMYRIARHIAPPRPSSNDRKMAKKYLHEYVTNKELQLYDWCKAEFGKKW